MSHRAIRLVRLVCLTSSLSCIAVPVAIGQDAGAAPAPKPPQVDRSRYPRNARPPDWLWSDQRRTAFISESLRKDIEHQIKILDLLKELNDDSADQKADEISSKLTKALALRDLACDATIITNGSSGLKLAVQIDPQFSEGERKTLLEAARLFVLHGLDDDVVEAAMTSSIEDPKPMPDMYVTKDGQPRKDSFGNLVFTDNYKFYLQDRQRPKDAASFKSHLRSALTRQDGDPALLVISRYSGGLWWGLTYIGFFEDKTQQLSRLTPPQSYAYISLNSDKMRPSEPNWNDATFWASKIGHEFLHALDYNHPTYNDVAERDQFNQGNSKAFIVAYEFALLDKLKNVLKSARANK